MRISGRELDLIMLEAKMMADEAMEEFMLDMIAGREYMLAGEPAGEEENAEGQLPNRLLQQGQVSPNATAQTQL